MQREAPLNLALSSPGTDGVITLGVCTLDKKANSKHMQRMLSKLPQNRFEVVVFGDECILHKPVSQWPLSDCLIAFFSAGFPLEKAQEYVSLRQPYTLNDLSMQHTMQDRRQVYDMLEKAGVGVPNHVFVSRDGYGGVSPSDLQITEHDDYVEVNGKAINKPFVEKPVDAEDHNIYIYYPMSAGGGSKRLFRKVKDRSSEFYPDANEVRRDGSYIYEEFVETQGTDVKVYTVGPNYGHAEARKSPTLDGKVNRDSQGKEIRYPVILSAEEKDVARRVALAFGQCVCGFDILRVQGKSYVCDVNGWSMVKSSRKYHEDCAMLLCEFIEAGVKGGTKCFSTEAPLVKYQSFNATSRTPTSRRKNLDKPPNTPGHSSTPSSAQPVQGPARPLQISSPGGSSSSSPALRKGEARPCKHAQELRCVIAITRHGDRTPKQKMKMHCSFKQYLSFFERYSEGKITKDLKVKAKVALKEFLSVTCDLLEALEKGDDDTAVDSVTLTKVVQIRQVLERWEISGINRKLQLKPQAWEEVEGGGLRATKLLLILKWGGELTRLGESQAMELGDSFRRIMYPDSGGGGLLRLHSTFRHDLKIKTSDEGRVMKTAAAFAKGFLELEGDLTPILVSLVHKEKSSDMMLDQSGNKDIKKDMERSKNFQSKVMEVGKDLPEEAIRGSVPAGQESVIDALRKLSNPRARLKELHGQLQAVVAHLQVIVDEYGGKEDGRVSSKELNRDRGLAEVMYSHSEEVRRGSKAEEFPDDGEAKLPSRGETPLLMLDRWRKLEKALYCPKTDTFDITKIPDVHDNVRYDCLHNAQLQLPNIRELYDLAKKLADCIVPQEYGITVEDKLMIGSKMCSALMEKIKYDLIIARSDDEVDMRYHLDLSHAEDLPINSLGRRVRTRLYFTSESMLHTLLNVLRYPVTEGTPAIVADDAAPMVSVTKELCYLTSFVIRLFEDTEKDTNDPSRFRVEILFSPGVVKHPLVPGDHLHTVPLVPLNKNLTCAHLEGTLDAAISLGAREHLHEAAQVSKDDAGGMPPTAPQAKSLDEKSPPPPEPISRRGTGFLFFACAAGVLVIALFHFR
ncbi:unnamed protein product [Chrysoparadoxa australica]